MSQELADDLNVCYSTNRELDLSRKLSNNIIHNVLSTFIYKNEQFEREDFLSDISPSLREEVHKCLID